MPPLPRITGRKLLNCLQKFGFKIIRSKGSHFFMKYDDGRRRRKKIDVTVTRDAASGN
ncbi:MAG: addiction module toxin, HicA family [Candidatus Nitronauta litoralis]|uniref:Addiction module toxin, HicA family n=1 Tax=Candidatus Nitronauta litoralis TaxID=2705533 RepID=A0A7T0BWN6_9BACT|nr:MAG: addiction module toxin, HicA family [Candidatus Nitronauta litoralis]